MAVAGAVLMLMLFAGCGGSPASPSPTPTPTPDPPFTQTITGSVVAFGFNPHALTTARAGTMKAVLTWANGAIDLDLYMTTAACTTYPPLNCATIATSEANSGTSETVSRTVASGEQYKLWVDNFSATLATDYSIQLTIQ
jgi:hypothetical protein